MKNSFLKLPLAVLAATLLLFTLSLSTWLSSFTVSDALACQSAEDCDSFSENAGEAMIEKSFIESYYQTYNSENAEALSKFYHPEVELISGQGTMRGPEEILQTYSHITSQFSDQMTPESIVIEGSTAIVEIHDKFTAKTEVEDFMGMSFSKGQGFEMRLRGTYEVLDGQFRKISLEMLQ